MSRLSCGIACFATGLGTFSLNLTSELWIARFARLYLIRSQVNSGVRPFTTALGAKLYRALGLFVAVSGVWNVSAAAQNPQAQPADIIARSDTPHVRVLTWNIRANSVFADPGEGRAADAGQSPDRRGRGALRGRPSARAPARASRRSRHQGGGIGLNADAAPLDDGRRWQSYGIRDVAIATPYSLGMRAASDRANRSVSAASLPETITAARRP